jgi:hypothetical protein
MPRNYAMNLVKMQVYFDANYPATSDFLHREKVIRARQCIPLLTEIMDVKTKSVTSYESLYRKIVTYLLMKTHVGSATDLRVIRESTGIYSLFDNQLLSSPFSLKAN